MESVETQEIIFIISEVIDFAGVAIIALGALIGVILCIQDLLRQERAVNAYRHLRTFLGRSLLLGLEFLVAGDIIKTVAIEPTFDSVIVLAIIVLVRTVLSLSIDVEIDGRWPWQAAQHAGMAEAALAGTSDAPRHTQAAPGTLRAAPGPPSVIASDFLRSRTRASTSPGSDRAPTAKRACGSRPTLPAARR